MYHSIAIVLALQIALWLGASSDALIYLLSLVLTVVLAGISYKFFESYFLNLKTNYSTISSGDGKT